MAKSLLARAKYAGLAYLGKSKMRSMIYLAMAGVAVVPGTAWAQDASKASVDSYLCQFAGKCGDTAAAEPADDGEEAPETKGFSMARPKGQEAAPATRGFSMARPKGQEAAPSARGFSMARQKPASASVRPAAANTRVRPSRRAATSVASAATAAPRADLMLSFELNSSEMTGAAKDRARVFAQALNTAELRQHRFQIEGHTDSVGGRAANLDLSRRRAQSVADFLVGQGVDRSRLEVKGMAYDRPLPGKTVRAQENRRVEAVLIS